MSIYWNLFSMLSCHTTLKVRDPASSFPSSLQSLTSSLHTRWAASRTSFWERTQSSRTVGRRSSLVWPACVRMTSVVVSCWKTHGPPSWRLDSTVPALEMFPSTTMSCRAPSTSLSKISSMGSSPPTCEWTLHEVGSVTLGQSRICSNIKLQVLMS